MNDPIQELEQEIRQLKWKQTSDLTSTFDQRLAISKPSAAPQDRRSVVVAITCLVLGLLIGRTSVVSATRPSANDGQNDADLVSVSTVPATGRLVKTSFRGPNVAMLCSQVGRKEPAQGSDKSSCLNCHKGLPEAAEQFHHNHQDILPADACRKCHVHADNSVLDGNIHQNQPSPKELGQLEGGVPQQRWSPHGTTQDCRVCHVAQRINKPTQRI